MRSNWIRSLVTNSVILLLMVSILSLCYETNDDYGIALRIQAGFDEVLLINRFLAKILVIFQGFAGRFNVFVAFQIAASFCAFTVMLKIMLDRNRGKLFDILTIVVLIIFSFDHYVNLQFTKTAALLAVTGMMVLVDAFLKKRRTGYEICGIVFVYLGASLRFITIYVSIAFAAVALLFILWDEREQIKESNVFSKRNMAIQMIVIILIAGTYVYREASYYGADMEEYKAYNRYRANVIDYPVYQSYDAMRERMEELDISENDLLLIDHWFLDTEGAASLSNMRAIDATYRSTVRSSLSPMSIAGGFLKGTISQIRHMNPRGVHLLLLAFLAIAGMISFKPRYLLYIVIIGALTVLCHLYIYYVGRAVPRAFYVADLAAALWLLYGYQDRWFRMSQADKKPEVYLGRVAFTVCIIASALLVLPLYNYSVDDSASQREGEMSETVSEYVRSRPDMVFVFGTRERGHDPSYRTPLRLPEKDAENNIFTFGSWGTYSPFLAAKMKQSGIDNVFSDAIDDTHMTFVMNRYVPELEQYFNKWYGSPGREIKLEKTGEIDGMGMWKVKSEPV